MCLQVIYVYLLARTSTNIMSLAMTIATTTRAAFTLDTITATALLGSRLLSSRLLSGRLLSGRLLGSRFLHRFLRRYHLILGINILFLSKLANGELGCFTFHHQVDDTVFISNKYIRLFILSPRSKFVWPSYNYSYLKSATDNLV